MSTANLFTTNPYFHLHYATLNMDDTTAMLGTANHVSTFASRLARSFDLASVVIAEIIKNGFFLIYNAFVFVINTVSYLISRIFKVFSDSIHGNLSFESINAIVASPPIAITSNFSNEMLSIFRRAMRIAATKGDATQSSPIVAYIENKQCAIWFDLGQDKIFVQDRANQGNSTLTMKINEYGYIFSLEVDGIAQERFPDDFVPLMWVCYQESLKTSSEYKFSENSSSKIEIRVVRDGLKEIPEFHLNKLAEQIVLQVLNFQIDVNFLDVNLERGEGIDAGGPRRDYMDDLWGGLLGGNSQVVKFSRQSGFSEALPKASEGIGSDGIPQITPYEYTIFQNMGQVMMYCYFFQARDLNYEPMLIGRRFEEGLFKAAFSLNDDEVNADHLPFNVQLKMMRAILECRELNIEQTPVPILEKWCNGNINWGDAKDYVQIILGEDLPPNFDVEHGENQNRIIDALKDSLYNMCGSALVPIHQIAKGMKLIVEKARLRWNHRINWKIFCDKVQGSLDKNSIANLDISENYYIQRKGQWIREWILDPATTNEQLQQFIKFATGSSSLGLNARIRIRNQVDEFTPWPKAHTCFNMIDLAPINNCQRGAFSDGTKEEFLKAFTYAIQNSEYQMG